MVCLTMALSRRKFLACSIGTVAAAAVGCHGGKQAPLLRKAGEPPNPPTSRDDAPGTLGGVSIPPSPTARNVFTVFNHGTDFHRDKDPDELITVLSEAMSGTEARIIQTGPRTTEDPLPFRLESPNPSYLICEGPGSESVSAEVSKSGIAHSHPGKYNPILDTPKTPGASQSLDPGLTPRGQKRYWIFGEQETSVFQDEFLGNTPQPYQTTGRLLGTGWDDNVYKVVWLITHLKFEMDQPIDTVNIIGWSRGAVTCLKMANKLFEVFEDTVLVNIFAVDPVPGGLTPETVDTKTIPPNVRDYLAILALDDDRSNFQPLDRSQVTLLAPKSQYGKRGNPASLNPQRFKPRVHFLPMPGNHSDLVNSELSSVPVTNSAKLCRHLAWKFLTAHKSLLTTQFDYTPDEICRLYNDLKTNREVIADKASGGLFGLVGGKRKERAVRFHRAMYVHESGLYINEHHRQCARVAEPVDCPESDASFSEADWTTWTENRTYDLPKEQACLHKLGVTSH